MSVGHILSGVMFLATVTALVLAVMSLAKVRKLDGELSALASQQQAAQQDTRVAALQGELTTLRRQLADNSRLIAGNRQTLTTALQQKAAQSETDADAVAQQAQTLKALTAAQEGLKTRIRTLETQLATLSPVATSGGTTTKPTGSATPGAKPASARRHKTSSSAIVQASNVPFVLTGTERRGAASLAAIAPEGYTSLSQIALIGEGESVAGWTLVHAGYGQATFRVRGRTVLVSAQ
ncbi:TPA: hypothetical protein I8Y21_004515 [Klebsiella oxytoca]|uniref:Uncharacterized protein n=1 Tax=Klebsiella oxytoca TaxID=571 RepID=A0AAN5LC78_KLEOX|nr:hypothetical protein [Klebsiella oxytoca]